jgi:glycosyltransferase involved in cell wall biosynthesis
VKPSVKYLKSYLKEHPVDAIISTGPPHSMHLIAMKLKEALDIPWVADFRDPWTEIDYYKELHLTHCSDRKHHRLEHEVLTKADKVVTVSPNWAARLDRLGANNAITIYNGFDSDDSGRQAPELPKEFTITYLGVLSKAQNPENLWEVLGELINEDTDFNSHFHLKMIGQIDSSATKSIQKNGLSGHVTFESYIPHDQVGLTQRSSTLLLLLLLPDTEIRAKGLLTGKMFEYMASGRPILCIGPEDGDAANILREHHTGTTVGFENKEKMKAVIKAYYTQYSKDGLPSIENNKVERYSRKAMAGEYATLLNNI